MVDKIKIDFNVSSSHNITWRVKWYTCTYNNIRKTFTNNSLTLTHNIIFVIRLTILWCKFYLFFLCRNIFWFLIFIWCLQMNWIKTIQTAYDISSSSHNYVLCFDVMDHTWWQLYSYQKLYQRIVPIYLSAYSVNNNHCNTKKLKQYEKFPTTNLHNIIIKFTSLYCLSLYFLSS